jgi:aldose 1-epimerase
MLEMGTDFIPTGKIIPVAQKGFSQDKLRDKMTFREDTVIGLNHYYLLDKKAEEPDATLFDPLSGRMMEVFTSYPGLLLYTGDYLSSQLPGHLSKKYKPLDGLCLECQYYPDSPHHPHFPSTVLESGQNYEENIIFKFKVR